MEDKPVYGENYVSDYRIHFSIVQVIIDFRHIVAEFLRISIRYVL